MGVGHYKRILLAVDFGPNSEPVIARAIALRDLWGAALLLLHAVEPISTAVEYLPLGAGGELPIPAELDLEQDLLALSRERLDALGERLGVPAADRLLRVGSPGHSIDAAAAELGVDLIMVGSHGQHGLLGLFGSTAKSVLGSAVCDVLCVRISEEVGD